MGKIQHKGFITQRRSEFRQPDLGYYLIVTDGKETERNFFEGMRNKLPDNIRGRLVIKVKTTKTYDMVDAIITEMSMSPRIYDPWIIFDMDQVHNFDELIEKAHKLEINVGWSNPCIEILFLSYFSKSPSVANQTDCIKKFSEEFKKKTQKDYNKNNKQIYDDLCQYGNEEEAIKIQDKKFQEYQKENIKTPSKMSGVSKTFVLIKAINRKIGLNI